MSLSLPYMHRQWTKYSMCQKVLYYPKNIFYKGEKSLGEFRMEEIAAYADVRSCCPFSIMFSVDHSNILLISAAMLYFITKAVA